MDVQRTEVSANIIVCTAVGEIDARTAPLIQENVLPDLRAGRSVAFDVSGITYTSSAGLRMLLLLHRHAAANSAKLVLCGLGEDVASVMAATGFLDAFEQAATADEAVQGLS